jgi:hypothetical protein
MRNFFSAAWALKRPSSLVGSQVDISLSMRASLVETRFPSRFSCSGDKSAPAILSDQLVPIAAPRIT